MSADLPTNEDDRYAIYRRGPDRTSVYRLKRLCETSREGIGLALETMIDDGELPHGHRFGVFDRRTRRWLVNPFA